MNLYININTEGKNWTPTDILNEVKKSFKRVTGNVNNKDKLAALGFPIPLEEMVQAFCNQRNGHLKIKLVLSTSYGMDQLQHLLEDIYSWVVIEMLPSNYGKSNCSLTVGIGWYRDSGMNEFYRIIKGRYHV